MNSQYESHVIIDLCDSEEDDHPIIQTKGKKAKKNKKIERKRQKQLEFEAQLEQQQQLQAQIARIQRSKKQKIYLLNVVRKSPYDWNFEVLGSQKVPYHVSISNTVLCTCRDFQRNWKPCKHIYFIVTQVAKNDRLLSIISNDLTLHDDSLDFLDVELLQRLQGRINNLDQPSKINKSELEEDKQCAVCYMEMTPEHEKLQRCNTCKKYFHEECLKAWKSQKQTCPLCRTSLSNIVREKGAFQMLQKIELCKQ